LQYYKFSSYEEALIKFPKLIEISSVAELAQKSDENVEKEWLKKGIVAMIQIGTQKYLGKRN
jgi:hypothetical protein